MSQEKPGGSEEFDIFVLDESVLDHFKTLGSNCKWSVQSIKVTGFSLCLICSRIKRRAISYSVFIVN